MAKAANVKTNSLIGENSYFTGRFFINGSLRVDGKFEGKSMQADKVYIGERGKVKSNISANFILIEGLVVGNIVANLRVIMESTAKVLGDIRSPELTIVKGAILEGRCTVSNDLKVSANELIMSEWGRDGLTYEKLFGKGSA